ncbi:sulfurtransferase [Paenibacillus sp. JSM ZJ436]|uniref:sulfurtransferase n=1 Tax=Paenibacillus sp. JSM ZJ436 TaxID=3376190 RepID=UPI003791A08D
MSFRVKKQWLLARLYEPDLVIVDCRFALGKADAGQHAYEESHIPRAVYLDLERNLSAPVTDHGGRHPLPDAEHMAKVFGQAGISRDSRVVIYDDQNGMVASRLWWMLRFTGHQQTYVLEEGFTAWSQAGYPVTADLPVVIPATYDVELQGEMVADVEHVRKASFTGSATLIDSREPSRYLGLEEPIDAAAGHIPGAVNYFWKDLLTQQGSWKSPEEWSNHFQELPKDQELIIYCGSGVSACPNVLALLESGFTHVKLYPGSWSDWISYRENPVAVGDE